MSDSIFVIGDPHLPYQHVDMFEFVKAIMRKYRPDRYICIGDEVDGHRISYHEPSPELPGPKDECDQAAELLGELHSIIPKMDILESNHGSLPIRKSITAGLPNRFIKTYNDAWGVGPGWRWQFELVVQTKLGPVYFHHGKSANVLRTSQAMGMSAVQGHYHELFGAQYWGNPLALHFAAQTGCLVDWKSLAMAYGKNNLKRPVLGSLMILDGKPVPIPMHIGKNHRWDRTLIRA